jgi:adenylyltransferase/sulfurtransferase
MLTHEQITEGKTPTTPTSSSVIAGIQVQELLKLLHKDRELPTLAGKGYVFNGLTHDSYVVEYQLKNDCMSHDTYENIEEKPWSAKSISLRELLSLIQRDIGETAVIDFDRDIATVAKCSCGVGRDLCLPIHKLKAQDIACPDCDKAMIFDTIHTISGVENFLDKTPYEIGIPLLHIIGGRCGTNVKYYEFSADKTEVFKGIS